MKLPPAAVFLAAFAIASASSAAELTPRQIYERAAPGVVLIIGHPEQGEGGSGGTGSIIRKDGLVLSNAHVVIDEKTGKPYPRLSVYLKPDRVTGSPKTDLARKMKASVTAFNRTLDLALLKLEGTPPTLPVLELTDPDRVKIGERVVAIGHPEQGGLWTLTTGVVSAEFEDYGNTKGKHVFQTETGLNRGNSGGPLLDTQGRIVGVNTAIARLAADGVPIMSISFAVKSSVARSWLRAQSVMVDYAGGPAAAPPERPPVPAQAPQAQQAPIVAAPEKPASPPPQAPKTTAPPPRVHTEIRPYDLDELIRGAKSEAERDLERMMQDMRRKPKPK
jgi:serine protease Do